MQLHKATKGVTCLQFTPSLMKVHTRRKKGVHWCWQLKDKRKRKDLSQVRNHYLRESKNYGSTFWKDKERSLVLTLFIALCHSVMFFRCAFVNWSHDLFLVAASNTLQISSPERNLSLIIIIIYLSLPHSQQWHYLKGCNGSVIGIDATYAWCLRCRLLPFAIDSPSKLLPKCHADTPDWHSLHWNTTLHRVNLEGRWGVGTAKSQETFQQY